MTDGKTGSLGSGHFSLTYGWYLGGDTAWQAPCPWWRPPAIDHVADTLPADGKVLEWGAGGSTVWLAGIAGSLVTLELDGEWYNQVQRRLDLAGLLRKVRLLYFGPQESEHARWRMYADYALMAEEASFDLVVVDGRVRARCLGNALSKVKVGGMLLLDNSERSEYAAAVALVDGYGWPRRDWGDEGWMTTVWTRPETWTPPAEVVRFAEEDA